MGLGWGGVGGGRGHLYGNDDAHENETVTYDQDIDDWAFRLTHSRFSCCKLVLWVLILSICTCWNFFVKYFLSTSPPTFATLQSALPIFGPGTYIWDLAKDAPATMVINQPWGESCIEWDPSIYYKTTDVDDFGIVYLSSLCHIIIWTFLIFQESDLVGHSRKSFCQTRSFSYNHLGKRLHPLPPPLWAGNTQYFLLRVSSLGGIWYLRVWMYAIESLVPRFKSTP